MTTKKCLVKLMYVIYFLSLKKKKVEKKKWIVVHVLYQPAGVNRKQSRKCVVGKIVSKIKKKKVLKPKIIIKKHDWNKVNKKKQKLYSHCIIINIYYDFILLHVNKTKLRINSKEKKEKETINAQY